MKIKNKSAKIITIGELDILPDNVVDLDEDTANNPVVKLFLKNGFLKEIPATKVDDIPETTQEIAERVKKMKKPEICEQLKELNAEFDENEKVDVLRQKLIEALA